MDVRGWGINLQLINLPKKRIAKYGEKIQEIARFNTTVLYYVKLLADLVFEPGEEVGPIAVGPDLFDLGSGAQVGGDEPLAFELSEARPEFGWASPGGFADRAMGSGFRMVSQRSGVDCEFGTASCRCRPSSAPWAESCQGADLGGF
jgi:hypothetical protein